MKKPRNGVFALPLLFALIVPAASAQYHNDHRNDTYDRGMRQGGHGGQYYDNRHPDHHYDQPRSGGIGPGKGALIGGAAGGALGAIFSGSLKGAIVGGAAGAGIGAVAGQANQNNKRNDYYDHHR